jgi:hypothetical protein
MAVSSRRGGIMERYYKTRIVIEVLSNEPITTPFGIEDLEDVAYEVVDGEWSGAVSVESMEELTKEECAAALIAQGSDPSFLITEDTELEEGE